MKWRSVKLGKVKLSVGELRSLHSCNSRDPKIPGTSIVGEYLAIYWNGKEVLSQIVGVKC